MFIMLVHIQRSTFQRFCCVSQHIDWKQIEYDTSTKFNHVEAYEKEKKRDFLQVL